MSTKKNTAFEVPHGEVNTATSKFLQALGEDGSRVITQMKSDPAFVRRLASFAKGGGYSPTVSHRRAQHIMGEFCLGPEVAMKHFDVEYAEAELAALAFIPIAESVLKACATTHMLVAGAPLSILDIRERTQAKGKLFYQNEDAWYNKEKFAKDEKVACQWYLIRKEAVANSFSKNWDEQNTLLTADECVPRACEVVSTTILAFLATGTRLFEKSYVRCADVSSLGRRVCVGGFDADGLDVSYGWGDRRAGRLGLAARRK